MTADLDPPVVHILSQEGGSERRCCNHCGSMIWDSSAPLHVDSWEDWQASLNNCQTRAVDREDH